MKTLLKSAVALSLLVGAAPMAMAQTRAAAPTAPAVPGLGVANIEAVIGNSAAFKVAQVQRPTTYKAQFDAAEARRAAITAQLQPMVEKFNRDRQAPTASTPAAQAALQGQAQTIQRIQESGQAELQKLLEPVALSEAYVVEQIEEKLNPAVQAAMVKKGVSLLLNPQAVIAQTGAYNLNQSILDELNIAIPTAQLVPPAGWEPRQVREQRAAQAGQQPGAAAAPARPSTDGR